MGWRVLCGQLLPGTGGGWWGAVNSHCGHDQGSGSCHDSFPNVVASIDIKRDLQKMCPIVAEETTKWQLETKLNLFVCLGTRRLAQQDSLSRNKSLDIEWKRRKSFKWSKNLSSGLWLTHRADCKLFCTSGHFEVFHYYVPENLVSEKSQMKIKVFKKGGGRLLC